LTIDERNREILIFWKSVKRNVFVWDWKKLMGREMAKWIQYLVIGAPDIKDSK